METKYSTVNLSIELVYMLANSLLDTRVTQFIDIRPNVDKKNECEKQIYMNIAQILQVFFVYFHVQLYDYVFQKCYKFFVVLKFASFRKIHQKICVLLRFYLSFPVMNDNKCFYYLTLQIMGLISILCLVSCLRQPLFKFL